MKTTGKLFWFLYATDNVKHSAFVEQCLSVLVCYVAHFRVGRYLETRSNYPASMTINQKR